MMSVFVLVVLSILGLALARLLSASGSSVVYEAYGVRALQAARTGLEIKLTELFPLNSPVDGAACDAATTGNFSGEGLIGCSYEVECDEPVAQYYRVTAVGVCQASDVVVSRRLQVDAQEL